MTQAESSAVNGMSRLALALLEVCSRHVVDEKWLLAPSYRVGFQWLEKVAMLGQPILNLHLKTLISLALQLVAERMAEEGLTFLHGPRLQLLFEEIFTKCCGNGGYLLQRQANPGLVAAACRSLLDLRLAGLEPDGLHFGDFEVDVKGRELIALLRAYQEELAVRRMVDYAGVLALAEEELRRDPGVFPAGILVVIPEDMDLSLRGRERSFRLALPDERTLLLPVDGPEEARERESDASLLRFINRPGEAPPPVEDGTVELFRAVGEANEVREILRRCLARNIPFDEVEILHTDGDVYVPLILEACSLLCPEARGAPPVTFSEGIPVRCSRPGRALLGWLSWIRDDFPQHVLANLIQEGLLLPNHPEDRAWSFAGLGALLLSLPIGKGRRRYSEAFASCKANSPPTRAVERENGGWPPTRGQQRRELSLLEELCGQLLSAIPEDLDDASGMIAGMADFLERRVRCVSEIDEYARKRLLVLVDEAASVLVDTSLSGKRIIAWMEEQAMSARVEGKGPRPGCIFVAPLHSGGHSGRPHTFIVGLDDGRFPGSGLQDPLLLDAERRKLSGELPTASRRVAARLEDFAFLLARLRGRVTMSYSCRDLVEDREMLPSQAVISAFRIITGNREGTQEDLLSFLVPPVSFAPYDGNCCANMSEWWIYRLCARGGVRDQVETVGAAFPHLGRGLQARRARESDAFTPYDGYVPEAGKDLDPASPGGPVLSTRRLEMLGRCPLEYFFAYILDITPPEEFTYNPLLWLDPREKGELLHRVFRKFHHRLRTAGARPCFEDHWPDLQRILDEEISALRSLKPPPNAGVFEGEREELLRAANIFLREDESCCSERTPLYFEVAVGMGRGEGGNPVDLPEPVEIVLPGGEKVRVRGYIDRIDALADSGEGRFLVCDYKTGSAKNYRLEDPFRQGRNVQGYIYKVLAEACLASCHPHPDIVSFEYFFPNVREHGERIAWEANQLDEGLDVLNELCCMLRTGCFPLSDDLGDVQHSDYRLAFGNAEKRAEEMRKKLANMENAVLAPLRRLRNYREEFR